MIKLFLKIGGILILGAVGGMLAQLFVLPYLAEQPYFQKFQFIKDLYEKEVIINPKEEIIIQENVALTRAIEKVEKTVVGVKTESKTGKVLQGSGVIITSDGLMITLAELVPQTSDFYFFWEGKYITYEILKRDLKNNLALIKVENGNLPTISFADSEKIKLGQKVFLVGLSVEEKTAKKIVNQGIISALDKNSIQTNIFDKNFAKGSPLFDIEGNLLGLTFVDSDGRDSAVPVAVIREFIGF